MFKLEKVIKDFSRAKKYFEDIVSYTIGPYTLDEIIKNKIDTINILDVRDYDNYIDGHIPYASHIPHKQIEENLEILDKSKITIIYSYTDSCPRAYNTALKLVENHYPAVILRGGFKIWKKFDFDIIKTDSNN
ncbi:hypothetical protein IJD44_07105 [bacterium]|nr:hypothetical protein [bacterium]